MKISHSADSWVKEDSEALQKPEKPDKKIEPDLESFSVGMIAQEVARRVVVLSPLLFLVYNTISSVFSLAAAVATIVYTKEDYDLKQTVGIATQIYPKIIYYTQSCDFAPPNQITVQCPYISSIDFQGILIVWLLFFAALIITQAVYIFPYGSNDLRFFIAGEKVGYIKLTRYLVYTGYCLCLVSMIVAFTYAAKNSNSSAVSSIIVSMIVNAIGLSTLATSRYKCLEHKELKAEFPNAVTFVLPDEKNIWNLYGILIFRSDLFDRLEKATIQDALNGNDDIKSTYGDVKAIKAVMKVLMETEESKQGSKQIE